ncbi:MAG: prepilin-type N-terminal cleavage/methylation domain-containing protein [Candidatus Acidiferrales bacterium]|jgi:prepilin-type N-terminal cleavage/methylation domain-containing protein
MRTQISTESIRRADVDLGFSLIELLIVVAIILIIAAIAVPNLLRSRIAANEASAVANLRTLTTAAEAYSTTYADGYPPSAAVLGGTGSTPSCNGALVVDNTIALPPGQKSGYTFTYTGEDGNVPLAAGCAAQGFNGFLATAVPINTGITGIRSFCSTEPGEISYDETGSTAASEGACSALPPIQ